MYIDLAFINVGLVANNKHINGLKLSQHF